MADSGKRFYIAGLNLTSDKKPFGKMGDLMCIADNIKMMTSICEICKNDNAVFSYFKGKKDTDIVIGDGEYIPVCRKCYEKLRREEIKKYCKSIISVLLQYFLSFIQRIFYIYSRRRRPI